MISFLRTVVAFSLLLTSAVASEPRTWWEQTGQSSVRATLIDVKVVLRTEDGRTIEVPLNRLSKQDQEYIGDSIEASIPPRDFRHKLPTETPALEPSLPAITPRPSSPSYKSDAEYKDFGRELAQVVSKMKEVAIGDRERSDLRTLEFLLRDYNRAVAAKNWRQADHVKGRTRVYLIRGGAVAAEAGKRKADRARADTERRHREAMRQKERHHRETMKKRQELIDQLLRL